MIVQTLPKFSAHQARENVGERLNHCCCSPAHDLALSVQYSGGREITENGVLKLSIPDTKFDQVADADEP